MSELRILVVVDDSFVNRRLITAQLKGAPYTVVECEDGRSALDYLRRHYSEVCLMLLDISMPDMSGVSVCQTIREEMDRDAGHLPIIAYTAHALPHERLQFLNVGFDDLLVKPFIKDDLMAIIERFVKKEG